MQKSAAQAAGIRLGRDPDKNAAVEWQAHLDAGRLTLQSPTPPDIRATHDHNHRALGLRPPRAG